MTRNSESRFSHLPEAEIQRSSFTRPFQHKTTFNAGELIPFFVDEVLPADTYSVDMATLIRMSTPIFPTMDNAYLDTYFFFVPNRLLWEHWKEFNGENSTGYWTQPVDYQIPMLKTGGMPMDKGSLCDYFGIPTGVEGNLEFSALPFRAYVLIFNEFFRDQNVMQPAYFTKSDSDHSAFPRSSVNNWSSMLTNAVYGAKPLPVSKYHDYFTSVLPQPQRGPAVDLPLYQDNIPVFAGNEIDPQGYPYAKKQMTFGSIDGVTVSDGSVLKVKDTGGSRVYGMYADPAGGAVSGFEFGLYPNNLYADVSQVAVATISQLRQAFQLQRLFEKDARGGKNSLCLHVKKIAEKIWKAFFYWLIRGEGVNQPQRIGNEIIFPRGRDTFVKRYANLY